MISLTATGTQHLFKDSNSKRYYFREQRDRKDIKKSLRTKDYDTAVKKLRELQSKALEPARGNTSVIEEWRIRAEARIASKKLKARSQEYNEECLAGVTGNQSGTIKATWPGFEQLRVSAIRNRDFLLYLPVAAKTYCATGVNGSLTVFRQLFALAIEMG